MNQSDHILELARHRRVLRAADVREHGWSPQLLIRLHQSGKLQRIARGLYALPDADITEHQTLIEVCKRVPKGVLCLLSALQFHEIGTQLPHEVWIALPEGTREMANQPLDLLHPPIFQVHRPELSQLSELTQGAHRLNPAFFANAG